MLIQSNGTQIHVEQRGSGDIALVFLHYYGGSSRTWDGAIRELGDQYQVVAIDHRGWGRSAAPATGYAITDLAADAEGVIQALGLQRYVLVGHSMGGKVAQLMASRRPAGLEGLVLVAPSSPSPTILTDEARATLTSAYQTRESVEFVIDHVLTARPLDAALRQQVIEDSLRGAPHAKAAWPNEAMQEDITAGVQLINVPTLVIAGECDQVDRLDTLYAELLPRIPHATLHVLPGVGHLSPLEAPADVSNILGEFVTRIASNMAVCHSTAQVPVAFDAAMNTGERDTLMSLFSNNATMRMTDGTVVQENPAALRE